MTEPRLAGAFRRLQVDLRALKVRWALVGGLAVSARAEPRTTRDIDVAVAVAGDSEAESLIRRLRDRGYLDEVVMEHRDVSRLSTVRLTHRGGESDILFDLLFASSGIEPEVVAEADLLEILPALYAPVASIGHLLALKVLALRPNRPQERPQDFADIRELLRVAEEEDLRRARAALELIARRGYGRGKHLEMELEEQLRQFRLERQARPR
jgi:predicted nucleotidyltransferase